MELRNDIPGLVTGLYKEIELLRIDYIIRCYLYSLSCSYVVMCTMKILSYVILYYVIKEQKMQVKREDRAEETV